MFSKTDKRDASPPPAYEAVPTDNQPVTDTAAPDTAPANVDLTAAFANLDVADHAGTKDVNVESTFAHLKLLHAIQDLKDDIGYTDGLFGLYDSKAGVTADAVFDDAKKSGTLPDAKVTDTDKEKLALSRIREKRWSIYVARAVDRYAAWWQSLGGERLREDVMSDPYDDRYAEVVNRGQIMKWTCLPPLDVVMVMHTHFLNPHDFMEDCVRFGLGALWRAGFPWKLVTDAIDTDFNFNVSDDDKAIFVSSTGKQWNNEDDDMMKTLQCPFCFREVQMPWTNCDVDKSTSVPLVGHGYGDGEPESTCSSCNQTFNMENLRVGKFARDSTLCFEKNLTMPGTVLETFLGIVKFVSPPPKGLQYPRTFPNRLVKRELYSKLLDLTKPESNMETVRDMIEGVLGNNSKLKSIEGVGHYLGRYSLLMRARVAVRKMLSRYWDNDSIFALDLASAVMRQGIFVDKMVKLDWLHSPAAESTVSKLILKYARFMSIMRTNPRKMAVPTLDVDLAWHTHQLSARAYYVFCIERMGRLIDHDDKIDETRLNNSFEWTTKEYQDRYREIYNECTCWYCQTIQSSLTSTMGRMFNLSSAEKLADNFYNSQAAKMCPPDNSAHISSHNAVRVLDSRNSKNVASQMRARQEERMEKEYQKACKRAAKKGRALPPRDQYYDHWGYSYFMYGPYMYPLYFAPGIYAGGYVAAGGACASGTCGGAIGGGGCGGVGGCGGSGAGAGACGNAAACGTAGGCGAGACGGGGGGGGCGSGGGGGCGGGGC